MRNYVFLIGVLFCTFFTSTKVFSQQAIIGTKTQFVSPSSILEFPDNDTRGIVLPKVNSTTMGKPVEGTLIFDTSDKKIKYSTGEGNWEDLSVNEGAIGITIEDTFVEVEGARTLIGSDSSVATQGVLVLDSTTKALVLPRVESPHLNMLSPATGTIVYDTKAKMICVFNGKEWAFWGIE